jgi:hypothetical protein
MMKAVHTNGGHPALADIAKGYGVVPWRWQESGGKVRKVPVIKEWQRGGVTAWTHGDAAHGIVLKDEDRLLLVDLDVKDGKPGIETFRAWCAETGLDPRAFKLQRTPSGGLHFIGRIPDGIPVDAIPARRTGRPDGVDLLRAGSWFGRGEGYAALQDLPPANEVPAWPVSFLRHLAALTGRAATTEAPPQEDLLAPSFERLVDVVNALPNGGPDYDSREAYLTVGYAIKAAAGPGREAEGLDLFLSWAARWEDGENDLDTVARDWAGMNAPYRVGWQYLASAASVPAYEAADEFEAGPLVLPDGFVTVRDLLAETFSDQRWLVDGLIPREGATVIGAKPKVGKSTLARAVAVAVAQGRPILGRDVTQGRVLYLSFIGEGNRADAQDAFRALGAGNEDDPYALVHWSGAWSGEFDKTLKETLERVRPSLVVVDTLQKLTRLELNDYSNVNDRLQPYQELFATYGAASMFIHHARKGESDDPIDLIAGSVAITGGAETVIAMMKKDNTRFIQTEQRLKPMFPDAREVVIDPNGWPTVGLTRQEASLRDMEAAVVGYLREADGAVPMAAITEDVEGRDKMIRAAVYRLRDRGIIDQDGKGTRGNAYMFSLTSAADEFDPAGDTELLD